MQESETTCRNRTQVSGFEQTSNQTVGHQDTVPTLYLSWPWNNERTNSNIKQTEATHPLATDANIRRREMNIIICKHIKPITGNIVAPIRANDCFFYKPPDLPQFQKKKKRTRRTRSDFPDLTNTMDTYQSRFYPKADFVKASFLVAPIH